MFEVDKKDINIFDSLLCGQIFRFEKIDKTTYAVVSKDQYAKILDFGYFYRLETTSDDYFRSFLNLDVDYKTILSELKTNRNLKDIIPDGLVPLRIFKQDLFEMIISFIISAQNNIPRIQGIVKRLAENAGTDMGTYYAFPTAEQLANKDLEFFERMGLGYRAPYVLDTAKRIASGNFNIYELETLSTKEAQKRLLTLLGVGPKVADCILLFGLNKYDVFPVDTWIEKVYKDIFKKDEKPNIMRQDFIKEFGNYSGIAQQYLFYAKRG